MRTCVVVILTLLLPLGARAADAPHPDSIDAATQQLDALKADANAAKAGTQSRGLPVIAVPEMHEVEAAPEPTVLPSSTLDKKQRKRSANWLVDGVMKPDPRDPRSRDRRDDRSTRDGQSNRDRLLGDASDQSEPSDPSDPTDRADATDRRSTAESARGDRTTAAENTSGGHGDPVFNPLTRYMGDWLSPQDAPMLRQTLSTSGADGAALPSTTTAPGTPTDSALGAALANFGGGPALGSKPAYEPPKPVENPYLQSTALPDVAPPASNPSPSDTIPAQAPASAIQPAPVAPDQPNSVIPDFAKPLDDDKYYKPLKRF